MQFDPIGVLGALAVLLGAPASYYVVHSVTPTIGRQRTAVRATSKTLILHAPFIFNPGVATGEKTQEVSGALRECAAQLSASTEAVRFYGLLALVRLIHHREAVRIAHQSLIGLSNSIHSGDSMWNARLVADLEDALGLGTKLGYRRSDFEDES